MQLVAVAAPCMRELSQFLRSEQARGKRIFPRGSDIFTALKLTTGGGAGRDPW